MLVNVNLSTVMLSSFYIVSWTSKKQDYYGWLNFYDIKAFLSLYFLAMLENGVLGCGKTSAFMCQVFIVSVGVGANAVGVLKNNIK